MTTIIVLFVYIIGVYIAYSQIQKWADCELKGDDYYTVFTFSLLSWLVFPIYGIVWIINKCEVE